MSNLAITLSNAEWQEVLDDSRQNPGTTWRVLGEDDYVLAEGRITHIPFIDKDQWAPTSRIFVGRGDIGEPICVGYIRIIKKVR